MYIVPSKDNWQGRIDGTEADVLRWHQVVRCQAIQDLSVNDSARKPALIGFRCDEGVRRNKGRVGAKEAPSFLRKACANFPVHDADNFNLIDLGDIECEAQNLEKAQAELAVLVSESLHKNHYSVVLGGGHEVLYGHFQGIKQAFPNKKIGIINFDAHFDMREPDPLVGVSSGTGFWQIAQEEEKIYYLALGIQENSNTRKLFDFAEKQGVEYVLGEDFMQIKKEAILLKIKQFIDKIDVLYLTICLDVFAAPYAPAVSAVAYNGIIPDEVFRDFFHTILASPKLVAADIAELNPSLDIDNRTARFAASLLYKIVTIRT